MNSVQLIGRLTKDPEVRYTESGTAVARFTVAVDRIPEKDGNKQADFISCVAFKKTAELMEKYFSKGSQLGVSGRIQTGSYEKNGQKIYTTDVIVDRVDFCGSKSEGKSEKPEAAEDPHKGFVQITTDDIPF